MIYVVINHNYKCYIGHMQISIGLECDNLISVSAWYLQAGMALVKPFEHHL